MYYTLGTTQFVGLFGPSEFERETESYYAENELIGGKGDLQATGLALDNITLLIRLHESFCDPELRYVEFETYRRNFEVLPFLDGVGNIIGNFVILKIKQTLSKTDRLGRVTHCELELTLKEFVDPNRAVSVSTAAKRDAFALVAVSPALSVAGAVGGAPADVFKSVIAVNNNAGLAVAAVNSAVADADRAGTFLQRAASYVDSTMADVAKFQDKLNKYGDALGDVQALKNAVASVGDNGVNLKNAALSGNVANALASSTLFNSSLRQMGSVALPVQKQLIIR